MQSKGNLFDECNYVDDSYHLFCNIILCKSI